MKSFGFLFRFGPLDIRVRPGEVLSVMGPSSAGKTTLLKLLWGFLRPDQGRIFVFGMQPHLNQMRVRRRAGYVSENVRIDSPLTASQYLQFIGNFYEGWKEQSARRLMEQLGVDGEAKVENLSRGERLKLGIVSAASHRPALLILDEPTAGLDPLTRYEVLRFLSRFAREQHASIVISSNLADDLDHIADSILMLNNGHVVEYAQATMLNNAD